MWVRLTSVFFIFLVGLAQADIKNWQTGLTIYGTEAISPARGIDLSLWNTSSHNLKYADLKNLGDFSIQLA